MIHYLVIALFLNVASQTLFYNQQPCVMTEDPEGKMACYCEKSCVVDNTTGLTYPLMSFDESCRIKYSVYWDGYVGNYECWCPEKRKSCSSLDGWWDFFSKMKREILINSGVYLFFY